MGWSKNTESETHVVFSRLTFSDAGSTPAASTNFILDLTSTSCWLRPGVQRAIRLQPNREHGYCGIRALLAALRRTPSSLMRVSVRKRFAARIRRKTTSKPKATPKTRATGGKILDAALGLFRSKRFDQTTMCDIAAKAGVATGAAWCV